jgi:transcription elongation factor Elf1
MENYGDYELVEDGFACPKCGENRMDFLTCDPDDDGDSDCIRCDSCGTTYWLDFGEEDE